MAATDPFDPSESFSLAMAKVDIDDAMKELKKLISSPLVLDTVVTDESLCRVNDLLHSIGKPFGETWLITLAWVVAQWDMRFSK